MNDQAAFLERLAEMAKGTFWDHIGAKLETVTANRAVVSLDIRPHHLNLIGILHGGVHATLIDSAMGLVAMANRPNEDVVTTNLHMHYLLPADHGALTVTAELVHSSRRTITIQGRAHNGKGELCAFGTGTFRAVERRTSR